MHRIDGSGHVANQFSEGDPSTGTPATQVTDEWLNAVQEEIVNVIEEGGDPLDKGDNTQLLTKIQALIAATPTAPVGSVVPMPTNVVPAGYFEGDGAPISRTTYADLYAVIGTAFGAGDGATTFNLPDFRGEFLRGWDHGAGNDPDAASRTDRGDGVTGDNPGTKQSGQIQSHYHSLVSDNSLGISNNASGAGGPDVGINTSSAGGNETRPRNVNVMYCIKY